MHGSQTAVVVSDGVPRQTDRDHRTKVQFPWQRGGNAPAWFDGNGRKAVFTGLKSQALSASQSGSGGYQQLRLDDTPGQGRAQASTTQRDTTLTLGHLKGGRDNVRDGERGFGAELSTAAGGALRAGAGLLLSTERGRAQLDASGARAQLAQGGQLVASLDDVANAQGADLPGAATPLPAGEALRTVGEHLDATTTGSAPGNGVGGGEGEVPAWTAPLLAASSPDGIASLTPADQVWVSGEQTTLTAGQDLQWLTQGASVTGASGGIALYAHGSQPPAGKPNTETGIALHAAQGAVSARAPSATAEVAALTSVRIASIAADVQVAAPNKHLLATAAGAYIKLESGNIELGAPGTIEFKAAKKEWTSGKGASGPAPKLVKGELKLCEFKTRGADAAGEAAVPLGG